MLPGLADAWARLILATRVVDKVYRGFNKERSALVLALAPDEVLARFNCLAYDRNTTYNPDSESFRTYLFVWEEKIVASFFPPPPARLLIGGGGREALALAGMGYEVVAFEPSSVLAAALAGNVANNLKMRVYRAGYEDMPQLFPCRPDSGAGNLESEPPFGAGILGWFSYSHLRTNEQQIHTLSSFARYVRGPILVSFSQFSAVKPLPNDMRVDDAPTKVRAGSTLRLDGQFSVYIGFTHDVSQTELEATAERSGLKIIYLNTDIKDTFWPHAVLFPVDLGLELINFSGLTI
jgi:hypothetical protein